MTQTPGISTKLQMADELNIKFIRVIKTNDGTNIIGEQNIQRDSRTYFIKRFRKEQSTMKSLKTTWD